MNSKLLLLGALLGLSACTKELDRIAPASERSRESIDQTRALLESHPETWRLIYYPDESRSYGGYSYYLRFADGRVTATSELADTPSSSSYSVKYIDMPTLAFDTRNEILHHFATATEYFRSARGGDFELLIMGQRADTLLLRGRKYKNNMRLEPMTTSPAEEVAAIRQMHRRLAGKGLVSTTFGTQAQVRLRLLPTYRQLEYTLPVPEGQRSQAVRLPFHYTPEGISFYEPATIGGVSFDRLLLSPTGDALVTPDGAVSIALTEPPIDPMNRRYRATMAGNTASNLFARSLASANRTLTRSDQASVTTATYLGINTAEDIAAGLVGNDTPQGSFIFHRARSTVDRTYTFRLAYETDFVGVGDDPTLIDVVPLDGNESSYWYAYESLRSWINLLRVRAPYRVVSTADSTQRETYRLTSTRNDQYWFDLERSE